MSFYLLQTFTLAEYVSNTWNIVKTTFKTMVPPWRRGLQQTVVSAWNKRCKPWYNVSLLDTIVWNRNRKENRLFEWVVWAYFLFPLPCSMIWNFMSLWDEGENVEEKVKKSKKSGRQTIVTGDLSWAQVCSTCTCCTFTNHGWVVACDAPSLTWTVISEFLY